MKTILVITDHSPAAEHASVLALMLAQHVKAKIILANTLKLTERQVAIAGPEHFAEGKTPAPVVYQDNQILWNSVRHLSLAEISEIDVSCLNETQLAETINKQHAWMIVKSAGSDIEKEDHPTALNMQWVLNKIACPLLIVPQTWAVQSLTRLFYMADLRYCCIHVVKFLAEIAQAFEANLTVAHLSANGLPDMVEPFATNIFRDSIYAEVGYEQMSFNNIKERDLAKAADVIINGLHGDILAVSNHGFHYQELVETDLATQLPKYVTVPILIFPY